ncbi:hypothetical protein BT93_H0688 [Corymbia citriodora subsp. variegata]|nr:hypothetical protein BT93_H0688 [Corymbia citriodora subsp. variegata]
MPSVQRLVTVFVTVVLGFVCHDTIAYPIAKTNCPEKCGNVSIPYPFGIGKGCYRDKWFEITCNNGSSADAPVPLLSVYQLKVFELSFSKVRVFHDWDFPNCHPNESGMELLIKPTNYDRGMYNPFFFSPNLNTLIGDGCGIFTYVSNIKASVFTGGCFSLCQHPIAFGLRPDVVDHARKCLGFECCEAAVPPGLKSLSVRLFSIDNSSDYRNPPRCSRAFIAEKKFPRTKYEDPEIPMVLSWVSGNATCEPDPRTGNTTFSSYCGQNAHCVDFLSRGHRCECNVGFEGNPYLPQGCQDINECNGTKNRCADLQNSICVNTDGGFYCGYPFANGVAIGLTIIVTLAIGIWFAWVLRRTRRAKLKKAFFKRNGGLLFQQIASREGAIVKTEIFTSEELERATDNFSESRMCGKGGFGTVYKGMLSDGRIVAIKKSHLMHEKQVDQFINEVVILSEINHRNVVKLLGCCLETEVPLLVYEFVSNGTLSQHLHGEDRSSCMSWKVRMNIAPEIAGALAYLHSATSMPIFHRDVKSSNILLDNDYGAKISDFGISRTVSLEKTHLTTGLQGTFGYLDPEYFHSRQFTDKSDVYSFGVVLLELLTGERAVSRIKVEVEEKSLVMNFILAMKENRLYNILDDRVRHEAADEEVAGFATLAQRCLKLNGKKRPTMKEVAIDLEKIRRLSSLCSSPC